MLNNEPQTPIDMVLVLMYASLTIGIPFVIDYWFHMLKEMLVYE